MSVVGPRRGRRRTLAPHGAQRTWWDAGTLISTTQARLARGTTRDASSSWGMVDGEVCIVIGRGGDGNPSIRAGSQALAALREERTTLLGPRGRPDRREVVPARCAVRPYTRELVGWDRSGGLEGPRMWCEHAPVVDDGRVGPDVREPAGEAGGLIDGLAVRGDSCWTTSCHSANRGARHAMPACPPSCR